MNAYEIISKLLAAGEERSRLFPPLDDDGRSIFVADSQTLIVLDAPPDAEDDLYFSLSSPLLSLQGADEDVQLTFLWHLAEASAPWALPPGHALFGDSENLSIHLGCRFPATGLELAALETHADSFYRLAQALTEELSERLVAFNGPGADMAQAPPEIPSPSLGSFLRV
jgi:hypothetical protein